MYETQRTRSRENRKPVMMELSESRTFTPNFESLYDESYSRPKNLFFMNNTKIKSSIESLLGSESEESSSSVEDEMTDEQLQEWYDQPSVSPAPFRKRDEIRNHSFRSQSSNSVKRVGPLKSRELITVKPERVAKLIVDLKEQPRDITNFKDFLKAAAIPTVMTDEESFFVYCYLHGTPKWNIVARVNKEGRMVTVKVARKYRNRCSQKSDLPEEEIDNRLHDIASCEVDLPSSSRLSRDAIPYDRLEEDTGVLEDFVLTLQRKRSNPVTVAKWFIMLNAVRQPNIESFLQFDETYYQLTHLSDHEKFTVYALIYGQKRWKVLLEKERKEIKGVYVTFRELPEYLKDYDEISDKEIYKQLFRIALSDGPTRKELIRIGFKLPPEIIHGLPKHLQQWEDNFRRLEQQLTSINEMAEVFPEVELLSQEEKELLFLYYNNDQEWNIHVQSGTSNVHESSFTVRTRSSRKKSVTIPYQELDYSDEPMDLHHISLGKRSIQPARFAELFSKWATSPRKDVTNFDEFYHAYPRLSNADEFERFIIFTSIYRVHKWKLLFEMNNVTQMTRLRVILRHLRIDSDAFLAEYKVTERLRWLDASGGDKEHVMEWLRDSGFSIPIRYSLINRKCVQCLPTSLSDWSEKLKDPKYQMNNFFEFQNVDPATKVLRPEAQLILYTCNGDFQEWELVIHDDLPSGDVSQLYTTVRKKDDDEKYAVPYKGEGQNTSESTRKYSYSSDIFTTERVIALPQFSAPKDVLSDDDYEDIDLVRLRVGNVSTNATPVTEDNRLASNASLQETTVIDPNMKRSLSRQNINKLMNKGTCYLQRIQPVTDLDGDYEEIPIILQTDLDDDYYEPPPKLRVTER